MAQVCIWETGRAAFSKRKEGDDVKRNYITGVLAGCTIRDIC